MRAPRSGMSGGVLDNHDFRKLWAAQAISVYGTQITILAIPLVAASTLRVSPFEFGLLATLEFLPFVVLSLPAGVWVDRLRRRPILIVADVVRAAVLLTIPVAVILDRLSLWQLYAVVFANGCMTVFFDVAAQSYIPTLVARDDLVDGNAKLELSRTTSQRLGPGLAGLVVTAVSAPFAVIVDALSYGLSALFLSWIRRPEPEGRATAATAAPGAAERSMRREVLEGLRFVAGHRWLRALALSVAIGNFFGNVVDAILILYLVTERGFSAAAIGFAFTLGSVGVIGGALIAPVLTRRLGIGRLLVLSALGESLSWLPIALAPDGQLFAALTTTITALGFFGAFWTVNSMSLRQAIVPGPLQGRVTATMRFVSWGLIPLATTLGGALGVLVGLHATIVIGAVGAMLTFVPVVLSPVPAIRALPPPAAESATA